MMMRFELPTLSRTSPGGGTRSVLLNLFLDGNDFSVCFSLCAQPLNKLTWDQHVFLH